MLTVICGEDSINAYNYFIELKKKYRQKNYEVFDIKVDEIENITSWIEKTETLFSLKKVFFTQDLNKKISKKQNLKLNKIIEEIINNPNIELFDLEIDLQSRFLKIPKKAIIKEFKPSDNIFKLQNSLYPGNLKNFIKILNKLDIDQYFLFNMINQHVKNLILAKNNIFDKKLKDWQISKIKNQSAKWDEKKLLNFYEGLFKIEIQQKTSSTPYSIKQSLEILACYFL